LGGNPRFVRPKKIVSGGGEGMELTFWLSGKDSSKKERSGSVWHAERFMSVVFHAEKMNCWKDGSLKDHWYDLLKFG